VVLALVRAYFPPVWAALDNIVPGACLVLSFSARPPQLRPTGWNQMLTYL